MMLIKKVKKVYYGYKKILAEVKRGCAELIDEERIEKLIKNYYEKGEKFLYKGGV